MDKKKCIALFSGGLDSLLVIKIMKEQGFKITPVFFKLPFVKEDDIEMKEFCEKEKLKLKIFNCTKGKLFEEYMNVIRKPKYKVGVGVNPCIDCKSFMFKKVKEFADKKKIELIVSGEVLGERPLSQNKTSLNIIENESGLKKRILRPLSAKLLEKTKMEENNLVNRNNLYEIEGRQRKEQMELADYFKIKYPIPSGGCLLCERVLKKRLKKLFKRKLNEKEVKLSLIGRHFFINECWIVLGRNEEENKLIEKLKIGKIVIPNFIGPTAVILDEPNKASERVIKKLSELIKAYSKKGSLKQREKFEEFRL